MNVAIARIGRENHLSHLTKTLPFVTAAFAIQCYLINHFSPGISLGDYAMFLGGGLALFIAILVYYDTNHHVIIYSDHLHVYFPALGTNRKIYYSELEEIHAPKEECHFSSLILKLKDKEHVVFYFVDYPVHVKSLIEKQFKKQESPEEDSSQAA